jgi:ABC-type Fe3+/spermidine/putrescine transport system ATPase subunit
MIYVTHDQVEAMTLADRIAVMRGGAVVQLASPENIYNKPMNRYVAGFIGSPPMNFLTGRITQDAAPAFAADGLSIPLARYGFNGETMPKDAAFGIRPEHVTTGEAAKALPFCAPIGGPRRRRPARSASAMPGTMIPRATCISGRSGMKAVISTIIVMSRRASVPSSASNPIRRWMSSGVLLRRKTLTSPLP